ncbi:MAG: group I intron-associated PD-(D/E)XK endonuclease, partial [Gaiellaceae bacterium]
MSRITISFASFSSARPAILRACSSEVRGLVVLCLSGWIVARGAGVSNGHGPAGAIGRLSCVTTDQKGAIAELAIQLAATRLGIEVYKPVAEGGRYDMIFDLGAKLWRVQCKWACRYEQVVVIRCYSNRRAREGLRRRRYTVDEIDAFAAYCAELDRCFFIPIEDAPTNELRLRLSPPKNNQRLKIKWADEFDFAATLRQQGAVAQL